MFQYQPITQAAPKRRSSKLRNSAAALESRRNKILEMTRIKPMTASQIGRTLGYATPYSAYTFIQNMHKAGDLIRQGDYYVNPIVVDPSRRATETAISTVDKVEVSKAKPAYDKTFVTAVERAVMEAVWRTKNVELTLEEFVNYLNGDK